MKRRDLLSGIAAFFGITLVEKASIAIPTKEKAPKIREEIEKESFYDEVKRLQNVSKAMEILIKYGNYTPQKAIEIRKAICKRLPECEIYKRDFAYTLTSWVPTGWGSSLDLNRICIWNAACVTFRTHGDQDGFTLIDCEFPDLEKINKYKDIAQFKKISVPLVNQVYPELLI
jgi:hypothetical protein